MKKELILGVVVAVSRVKMSIKNQERGMMKKVLFVLVLVLLTSSVARAQSTATASWNPNPATDNVVQYRMVVDNNAPITILPTACSATICTFGLTGVTAGVAHTVSLTAWNATITGGTVLQSSLPSTASFTINNKPVVITSITFSVP